MLWKWDASKCVHTGTQTEEMHECDLRYNLVCTILWKWDASKCVHTSTQTEKMTYTMQMIWNAIWAYTNMREPQPHSRKRPVDENEVPRNACTRARKTRQWHTQCKWHENMIWKHVNGFSATKCGGKQPRNAAKTHPMHGIVPKHEFWDPKWPIAIPNMHNMDMQWKYRSKAIPR